MFPLYFQSGKKSLVPASIPASKTPYKWLNASPQPKNGSAAAVAPQAFRKALQSASNHFLDSPQGVTTKEGSLAHPLSVRLAPRDYYPPGYPDIPHDLVRPAMQLTSPTSSFLCREQKYFPGIYADTTLGCTVFHACASVDDKMVDKSYSCPEFTLFDQSVLMCNWWFYVDCKASGKLYDSNVPLSKSFRLMKALSFTLENET
ncbi:unnamed protein product [Timema podura]|uniref:Chitin-binding type-2 domain-containing protein n=1 Tax=Timema podura TaxID=61482 RepID=A0ABN7NWW8_TIMPD|nr:unnamed protein product [Timema podura]